MVMTGLLLLVRIVRLLNVVFSKKFNVPLAGIVIVALPPPQRATPVGLLSHHASSADVSVNIGLSIRGPLGVGCGATDKMMLSRLTLLP